MKLRLIIFALLFCFGAGFWYFGASRDVAKSKLAISGVDIAVPSGQVVNFHEALWNMPGEGLTYRYRFIAPAISNPAQVLDLADTENDMAYLCREYVLPRISGGGNNPNRIVISLSDKAAEFGVANPDVRQIFESYSLQDGDCIWEPF